MKKCEWCKKIIIKNPNEQLSSFNKRKFCNIYCYHNFQKKYPNSGTFKLGHPAPKTAFKKGCISPNKGKICKWFRGEKNPKWNGGKTIDKGYISLFKQNHPNATMRGYVREHRLVAEKLLGRFLNKLECIHHINEIKTDNRVKNLYLFSSQAEHARYHKNIKLGKEQKISKSNLLLK